MRVTDSPVVRRAALLFAAAFAVRAVAAAYAGISGPPVEDEIDYVRIAHALARGDGFLLWGEHFEISPRTSFRPPLLPLVVAPVAALGGGEAAMRIVSVLLGALAAPLAYVGLRRTSLGERAGWVGVALAVWPSCVYLSVRVLSEPLAQALLLGALAVPVGDTGRVGARRSALAGALAGLAVLARPASLVAAALLALCRGGWRRGAWFAAALVLVVAPWVVRNWALHGRPLLTTNTGVTLVGSNSQAAADAEWPGKWLAPDDVYDGEDRPPDLWMWGWSDLSEEASDRRFASDAIRWVREHPGAALVLAGEKVLRLFDPDQHSGKSDAGLKRVVGWATFGPVLVLAAAGLVLVRRERAFRPWLLVLAGTVASTVVFYGDVRMRNPAEPTLLALAATAALRWADRRSAAPRASGAEPPATG